MDRNNEVAKLQEIKDLLCEWAALAIDRQKAYPAQSAFVQERVDGKTASGNYYDNWPAKIQQLNQEIERLAPPFKRVLALEYLDKRPQKTKAAILGIPREVFSRRVLWIHEQLHYVMFEYQV